MHTFSSKEVLLPLSTVYVGDEDLTFISKLDVCEEGLSLFKERYLLSAVDARINSYSSLYLTRNTHTSELLKLNEPAIAGSSADTTLLVNTNTGKHLHLPPSTSKKITPILTSDIPDINSIFEIEYQNSTTLRIACQRGDNRYYLHVKDGIFYFLYPAIYTYTVLNYILEGDNLFLFRITSTEQNVVGYNGDLLSLHPHAEFKDHYLKISPFEQHLSPKLDTTWVAYDTSNINALNINSKRSTVNLNNNFLISTQYSYVTGNTLSANILTLKNQYTNTGRGHRVNDVEQFHQGIPSVNKRDYSKLVTGVEQEKGNYNIILPYEYYSTDYKFKADEFTEFKLPDNLYPFSKINVNDAQFKHAGSIGGDTPYTADKIFFKDTLSVLNGEYLCTWLSAGSPNTESVWVDRYFYPERSSYFNALTGSTFHTHADAIGQLLTTPLPLSSIYDSIYLYTSLSAENEDTPRSIKSSLQGQSFFDKKSDLTFIPGGKYIYQRIGDKFVAGVVDALSSFLIQDSISAFTAKGVPVSVVDKEVTLDNDTYSLVENYRNINNTSQATVSLWVDMDDWQTPPGHQLIGSLNDRGLAMTCDPVITPFIQIQDGRRILTLNTNFEIIDAAYHNSVELDTVIKTLTAQDYAFTTITYYATAYHVKDIFRTDHLDTYQPVISYYTLSSINVQSIYQDDGNGNGSGNKNNYDNRCPLILIDSALSEPRFLLADGKQSFGTPLTGLVVEPCKLK